MAIPHLRKVIEKNEETLERIAQRLIQDVRSKRSLLVFGSGHSALFPLELYHRAGGPSFVIPLVADYFLPTAGPAWVRFLERTREAANFLLQRVEPKRGEMLWICSQSGINPAAIDLAFQAQKRKLKTVAFTSLAHSKSMKSRHPSGKRLFEVTDEIVDFLGMPGDAAISMGDGLSVGPLSTLTAVLLGHSILVRAMVELEALGQRCVYTSVNTPTGERRNRILEKAAEKRDFLL